MRSVILVVMKALSLSLFENALMYWNRSLVGDNISTETIISCLSLIIIL